MIISKETIKNVVSLYLHCQKLIQKPKRLHYSDLKSLLGEIVSETEFKTLSKSIFSLSDHYYLLDNHPHSATIMEDINMLADKLRMSMNPNQKLILLSVILKLTKLNKQENNQDLEKAFFCIAELFSFSPEQAQRIRSLFFEDFPTVQDYDNSILITNEQPDYSKVVDGLKIIYNPDFHFKIWVMNVKSVNNMLFKFIEYDRPSSETGIRNGDILTTRTLILGLLEENNINFNDLSTEILSRNKSKEIIQIDPTDRSPRIMMNSIENKLHIEGISLVNQPLNLFSPVFYWLDKMKLHAPKTFDFHVNLSFFSTYTSKIILNLFQKALELETLGCKVNFIWYHEEEDEDIKEAGEHYAAIINRPFQFVSTEQNNLQSA